jgi:hypothetical protein
LKGEKLCGSFELGKKMGPQIANPKIAKRLQITNQKIATFAEAPQI